MTFNIGDLVEVAKGEDVIRGRVFDSNDGGWFGAFGLKINTLLADGFTLTLIEKAAPPLPTEPGHYLDKEGDLWQLNSAGWSWRGRQRGPEYLVEYAPFTRLEPVPETAEKIAAQLDDQGYDWAATHIRNNVGASS